MIYRDLFIGFLKVGCFAFGGGYGAVSLIREVVLSYGWLSNETLTYMIAVSESTPGPIMVNMATYIGSSQAGFWGALIATAAVVLPSFMIILLVTALLTAVMKHPYTQAVLQGLKPCITGIILATGVCITMGSNFSAHGADWKAAAITIVLAAILFGSERIMKKKMTPIALIILAGFMGAVVYGL